MSDVYNHLRDTMNLREDYDDACDGLEELLLAAVGETTRNRPESLKSEGLGFTVGSVNAMTGIHLTILLQDIAESLRKLSGRESV